jgi:hypothetical protein
MPRAKQIKKTDDTPRNDLTADQKAILERVQSADTDWFTIGEESMTDFSLMNNPMDIDPNYPVAARLQQEKKYVFRWCERTPERVDELTRSMTPPRRWAIVNRQTLPEMSDSVDSVLGCVCCLDQMLLFKPYGHHMMVQQAKAEMADAKAKSPAARVQADKVETMSGPQYKIQGNDHVEYDEATDRDAGLEDIVVDE